MNCRSCRKWCTFRSVARRSQDESLPEVLNRTSLEELNHVRQVYWASMEGVLREPIEGRLLVDKNPELTMLLPLVACVFPEMKIVFALRDPRDVVISCFMQQLPLNPVSVHYLTLEGTVKKYAKTMRAWLKIRGMLRNPWIEIRYEDMVARPGVPSAEGARLSRLAVGRAGVGISPPRAE